LIPGRWDPVPPPIKWTPASLEMAFSVDVRFYTHHRLHSGIDYRTSKEYERVMARTTTWVAASDAGATPGVPEMV